MGSVGARTSVDTHVQQNIGIWASIKGFNGRPRELGLGGTYLNNGLVILTSPISRMVFIPYTVSGYDRRLDSGSILNLLQYRSRIESLNVVPTAIEKMVVRGKFPLRTPVCSGFSTLPDRCHGETGDAVLWSLYIVSSRYSKRMAL